MCWQAGRNSVGVTAPCLAPELYNFMNTQMKSRLRKAEQKCEKKVIVHTRSQIRSLWIANRKVKARKRVDALLNLRPAREGIHELALVENTSRAVPLLY